MTGSLQEKNGKYYAVINVTENGKRKQKWIATGYETKGNKKRAEQFLRDKLKEFEMKSNLVSNDVLFCDYINYWLEKIKPSIDIITYKGYSDIANTHIIPYFKKLNVKLVDMSRDIIQQYVDDKHKNGKINGSGGLSPKSIKTHMIVIQQTIKEAMKSNLILFNPCEFVVMPKQKKYEANFYTIEQLNALFMAIKNEELYNLIYLTVLFGLRRSEVLGLKWDSVNFDLGLITIKHTVVRYEEVYEKDTTKTTSSYRSYPLSEDVKQILISIKDKENENRKLFGKEYIENDYIFKWDNGKPYAPDYITSKFAKLLKSNNLPHIRFHDLRHSCASLLISKGFTLKDIQEWLGHADIQTTANIYSHLDIQRKNNISNSLSSTFNY